MWPPQMFQLYNAFTLANIYASSPGAEWQVPVLAIFFLVLCAGNMFTTLRVLYCRFLK